MAIKRSECHKTGPFNTGNGRWTDPVDLSSDSPITLVRKSFEKVANPLCHSEPGESGFVHHHPSAWLRTFRRQLTEHLSLLNRTAYSSLIHGNDHAFVGTANRQQILLGIFQIFFQSGDTEL